jgi:alcohol dehydrogenase (NADP+)
VSTTAALQLAAAGSDFAPAVIERRDLRPDDVRIDIAFAGICHTDLHYGHDERGSSIFPMVPGHEIAGTIAEVGPEVEGFAVGDRVGVGCIFNSCGECRYCEGDLEQYCSKGMVMTYSTKDYDGTVTKGGYSRSITIQSRYVVRIPDEIALDEAAPLLCAGITMYSPLRHWKVGPGSKVAIVGMGGLGHVGVKLAAAMGAEVTVLSRSLAKEEDAKRFGAAAAHATADPRTFDRLRSTFDLILNTVSADLDTDAFIGTLAVDGTMVAVGLPDGPTTFNSARLLGGRKSLSGTGIGGIKETQEMLDFCAEHDVRPEIERIEADPAQVATAWERIADGSARYRVVIDTKQLDG